MAADNRNFVNKFANEGGGDVLVEDKRLEELKGATAKTASQISTSTDYVPLQDTDGNLVKINPASFEEAVRNVLGSLLANNDKGTTISGIPALSGSGASLDFGSVTPANLASVLGGKGLFFGERDDAGGYEGNLNDIQVNCCMRIEPSATNNPLPNLGQYSQYGFLICFCAHSGNTKTMYQIVGNYTLSVGDLYIRGGRENNTWSNWRKIAVASI